MFWASHTMDRRAVFLIHLSRYQEKQRKDTEMWLMYPVKQEERDFMKEKNDAAAKGKEKPLPEYLGPEGLEFDIREDHKRDKET